MLYKIDRHPITGDFIMLQFEIMNRTPKSQYLDIQPRGLSNAEAMENTIRIRQPSQEYFCSPDEAIRNFVKKQENIIKKSSAAIGEAQRNIENIHNL